MIDGKTERRLLDAGWDGVPYLKNYSYDDALIGVTDTGQAVYDYGKMMAWLMEHEEMTVEEAADWIDYNTIRALPYMGEQRPLVMYPLDE